MIQFLRSSTLFQYSDFCSDEKKYMQLWHTAIDKVAHEIELHYFPNIFMTYSPPFVSPGEPLASSPEEPLPPPLARDRVLCSSTVCAA